MRGRGRKSLIWEMSDAALNALYESCGRVWKDVALETGVNEKLIRRRTEAGRLSGFFSARPPGRVPGRPARTRNITPTPCLSGKAGDECKVWIKQSAVRDQQVCYACARAEGAPPRSTIAGTETAQRISAANSGKKRTAKHRRELAAIKRGAVWQVSVEELWARWKLAGGNWAKVASEIPCHPATLYKRLNGHSRTGKVLI